MMVRTVREEEGYNQTYKYISNAWQVSMKGGAPMVVCMPGLCGPDCVRLCIPEDADQGADHGVWFRVCAALDCVVQGV